MSYRGYSLDCSTVERLWMNEHPNKLSTLHVFNGFTATRDPQLGFHYLRGSRFLSKHPTVQQEVCILLTLTISSQSHIIPGGPP